MRIKLIDAALVISASVVAIYATECARPPKASLTVTTPWPGISVVSLATSEPERLELNLLLDTVFSLWAAAYPNGYDQAAIDAHFTAAPVTFVLVPAKIACEHAADAGAWPGQSKRCIGLWYPGTTAVFVSWEPGQKLACTSVAHELSHMLSYLLWLDADTRHENNAVYGKTGLLANIAKAAGCPKK